MIREKGQVLNLQKINMDFAQRLESEKEVPLYF